jgi:hypothetical protein
MIWAKSYTFSIPCSYRIYNAGFASPGCLTSCPCTNDADTSLICCGLHHALCAENRHGFTKASVAAHIDPSQETAEDGAAQEELSEDDLTQASREGALGQSAETVGEEPTYNDGSETYGQEPDPDSDALDDQPQDLNVS